MRELLRSPAFVLTVTSGLLLVFLFTMNEALQGASKARISGVLALCICVALVCGFVFLGWRGIWSAAAIILGGMLIAPFGYGTGRSLLRRLRGP